MKVGDLVRCIEGPCQSVDDGIGLVIRVQKNDPDQMSIHVQWLTDDLWYHEEDLEVINESR